jgi:hypothetical protein
MVETYHNWYSPASRPRPVFKVTICDLELEVPEWNLKLRVVANAHRARFRMRHVWSRAIGLNSFQN